MSFKPAQANRFSLRRWSQRKLEAARTEVQTPVQAPPPAEVPTTGQSPAGTAHHALEPVVSAPSANAELPAIESLTIDSDFTQFFKPEVDESIKRAALKQLFRDPRFNIMDGLDTYIDDYTQSDPIPSAMLEDLMRRRVFFAPAAAGTDPGERAIDDPARKSDAPAAQAIAPPVAAEAPVAAVAQVPATIAPPVTPVEQVAQAAKVERADSPPDAAGSAPKTDAAKVNKS